MSREHSDRQQPAVELGCLNLLTIVEDPGPDVVIEILSHWVSSTLSIIDTQLYVNKCTEFGHLVRTVGFNLIGEAGHLEQKTYP